METCAKHNQINQIKTNSEKSSDKSHLSKKSNQSIKAHTWPKGSCLVIGDSMLEGLDERKMSSKRVVKVKKFPGATTDDVSHLLKNDMYVSSVKKAKGTKKCVIKQKLMFQNYKDCLLKNKTVYRPQERFKSYSHDVYTEEVNKIALSNNDDKRIQPYDGTTTYPYGTYCLTP